MLQKGKITINGITGFQIYTKNNLLQKNLVDMIFGPALEACLKISGDFSSRRDVYNSTTEPIAFDLSSSKSGIFSDAFLIAISKDESKI